MKRYPKIRRPGHRDTGPLCESGRITVLEKLDGNNFRFERTESNDLRFGSRRTKLGTEPDGIGGQFDAVTDYLAETVDVSRLAAFERELGPLVLFGENMVEHTLAYDPAAPQFLGFDVWQADPGRFMSFEEAARVFEAIGLRTVPVVETIDATAFAAEYGTGTDVDYEIPESAYRDGLAEGVVLRNDASGVRAKVVASEFHERHESASDEPETDTERLVDRYCTDARIEKAAHRLVDEGEYEDLQMRMMESLPMAVVDDVFDEEHEEIVRADWEIDMEELRNRVSNRCVPVLEDLVY